MTIPGFFKYTITEDAVVANVNGRPIADRVNKRSG